MLAMAFVLGTGPVNSAAAQECELEGSDILNQAEDMINQAAELEGYASEETVNAQYRKAWRRVQLALENDTSSAAAHYMAGRTSIGLGEYARADSMLDQFVELEPGCASIAEDIRFGGWADTFNEGIKAYQANDHSTALEKFDQANDLREDPRSLNNAALIHQQRGNTEQAEELYRASLELATGDEEFAEQVRTATINLAELLRNRGDREKMLEIYRDHLARSPDDVRATINFAVGLRETDQTDSARNVLQRISDHQDLSGDARDRVDSVLVAWSKEANDGGGSRDPSPACLKAFEQAAGVSRMEDQVSDLDPAVRACSSVEAWTAAARAHPGAVSEDVPPETFLENRCRYSDRTSGLRTTALCQKVLE